MKVVIANVITFFVGTRKLIAWFSLFLVAIIFRIKGMVDGAQFVDLIKATFLGFVAGNSTEHLATTIKSYIDSKGKTQEDATLTVDGA